MQYSSSQHHQDFVDLLQRSGLSIQGGNYHVNEIPIHKFQSNISHEVDRGAAFCTEFVASFEVHVRDRRHMKQCLEPIRTRASDSGRHDTESLCRVLLNIPTLQYELMLVLLDKVKEYQNDIDEDHYMDRLPLVILDQMRYLYSISKPDKLCIKLRELISTLVEDKVTQELFYRLPDIFTNEHESHKIGEILVEFLVNISSANEAVNLSALDALSHLQIAHEEVNRVVDFLANEYLESISIEKLPNIIQFILQHLGEVENQTDILNKLRRAFDVETLPDLFEMREEEDDFGFGVHQDNSSPHKTKWTADHAEKVCMDQFYNDMQNKRKTQQVFLEVLSEESNEFRVLDVWIIFMLYTLPHMEMKAMSLLKKKIDSDLITLKLITDSVRNHKEALRQHLPAICTMASVLLSSNAAKHWPIGTRLFRELFLLYGIDDSHQQLRFFDKLVVHLSSSSNHEKDSVLNILIDVVQETKGRLEKFEAFFQGTLDYLRQLNERQIRLFYTVCTGMSFAPSGKIIHDQFVNLVRKQLCNANIAYKRIGVIGLGCVMRHGLKAMDASTTELLLKDLDTTLNSALDIGCRRPAEQYFLFEEISDVLSEAKDKLPQAMRQLLKAKLGNVAVKKLNLIVPKSELKQQLKQSKTTLDHQLLLDDDSVSSVVNILGAVLAESGVSQLFADIMLQGVMVRLDPSDRAFGIRVLSYAVVAASDEAHLDTNKKERDLACYTWFGVLTWYREMLNIYCSFTEEQRTMYQETAVRITNELANGESKLGAILSKYSQFRMPKDCDALVSQLAEKRARLQKVIKSPKKSDAPKANSKKATEAAQQKPVEEYIDKYREYLRDLHPDTMILCSTPHDSESELSIEGWGFLLNDMNRKMSACLLSLKKATTKSAGKLTDRMLHIGTTVEDYVRRITKMIPLLLGQCVELTKKHDDFMVDDEDADAEEESNAENAVQDKTLQPLRQQVVRIFEVLQHVFSYFHLYATGSEKDACRKEIRKALNSEDYRHMEDGFVRLLDALNRLSQWCAPKSTVCVQWLLLMETVGGNISDSSDRVIVSQAAKAIMELHSKLSKKDVAQVMRCAMRYSSNPGALATEVQDEILLVTGKEDPVSFKNITAASEVYYFSSLLDELAQYFKWIDNMDLKDDEDIIHVLESIVRVVMVFQKCADSASKETDKKQSHQVALARHSKTIIKNFNDRCFRFFEMQLTGNTSHARVTAQSQDLVQKIVKEFNEAIRIVHRILLDNKGKKSKLLQFNADVRKEMERFNGLVTKIFSQSDFTVKTKAAERVGNYADLMEDDKEEDEEGAEEEGAQEDAETEKSSSDDESESSDRMASNQSYHRQVDDYVSDEDRDEDTAKEPPNKRQRLEEKESPLKVSANIDDLSDEEGSSKEDSEVDHSLHTTKRTESADFDEDGFSDVSSEDSDINGM